MWDPGQYLAFRERRLRPALELLDRVDVGTATVVVDLGCGPGHVTAHLRRRWPDSRILGVDASREMLGRARVEHDGLGVDWVEADIAVWEAPSPPDVIYSNAALHWLDRHDLLLPRLVSFLAPGGQLAVQMPRNHGAPSHTAAFDVARTGPWSQELRPLLRPQPVAAPARYHELLAATVTELDIWETEYLHVLGHPDDIVEWTKGSLLRPLLDALPSDDAVEFERRYRERIRAAYLPAGDGRVLFPFRRLFIVARR